MCTACGGVVDAVFDLFHARADAALHQSVTAERYEQRLGGWIDLLFPNRSAHVAESRLASRVGSARPTASVVEEMATATTCSTTLPPTMCPSVGHRGEVVLRTLHAGATKVHGGDQSARSFLCNWRATDVAWPTPADACDACFENIEELKRHGVGRQRG